MQFFEQCSPAPINAHKNYHKVSVDRKLFETPFVYVRVDRLKKGLELSYTGPYQVLERIDKYFTIITLRGQKNVSLDRLKSAYEVDILKDRSFTQKILKILLLQIQIPATIVQREQNVITTVRARSSQLLQMLRRH